MKKGLVFDAHRRTRPKKVNTESFLRFPITSFGSQPRCIKSLRSGKSQNRKIPPSIWKAFYAVRLSPVGAHSKSVQKVSKSIKIPLGFSVKVAKCNSCLRRIIFEIPFSISVARKPSRLTQSCPILDQNR